MESAKLTFSGDVCASMSIFVYKHHNNGGSWFDAKCGMFWMIHAKGTARICTQSNHSVMLKFVFCILKLNRYILVCQLNIN